MRKLIYFSLVFLLFFSYGCPFGSGVGLKVSTDKNVYQINEDVVVYIENETNSPAYFYHCNYDIGFYVEKKENYLWVQAFSHAIWCNAFDPSGILELAPGEIDTVEIIGWNWTSGVYRISAPYGLEQTEVSSSELLYSNQFIVQ